MWSIPLLEEFSQMVVLSGVFLFGDVQNPRRLGCQQPTLADSALS